MLNAKESLINKFASDLNKKDEAKEKEIKDKKEIFGKIINDKKYRELIEDELETYRDHLLDKVLEDQPKLKEEIEAKLHQYKKDIIKEVVNNIYDAYNINKKKKTMGVDPDEIVGDKRRPKRSSTKVIESENEDSSEESEEEENGAPLLNEKELDNLF